MSRCTCTNVVYLKGKPYPDVGGLDPDCPTHGLPIDRWPAGYPLHKYADEGEGPRDTETRLVREANWGRPTELPLPLRPCPPRGFGQR